MSTRTRRIRRYRSADAPALFPGGIRRLFLGTAVLKSAIVFWLVAVRGVASIASAFGSGTWHAHEMIFGFAAASGAGSLLRAIPSWTIPMPLNGLPLAVSPGTWLDRATTATAITSTRVSYRPNSWTRSAWPMKQE